MDKVGVYIEPGGGIGGAQYYAAVLAEGLSSQFKVDLIHHQSGMQRQTIETFTGLDLSRVVMRHVPRVPAPSAASSLPWRLWRQNSRWHQELSQGYDTFVNITHGVPPFNYAAHGVLVVLFPFFQRNWMKNDPPQGIDLRRRVRDAYYEYEWQKRMASYSSVTSISEFTRRWTREYWDMDSAVVYPPVDTSSPDLPKQDIVLSVGRFSTTGHPKKQDEIIRAFGALRALQQAGWRHHSAGALSESTADQAYFAELQSLAAPGSLLHSNVSRIAMKQLFAQAKLFVHAAGYGEPLEKPEATEHFGIATVEAMAAGAVPIVVNRGAQPEIVEHGVSGFVWSSIDELNRYIVLLANDSSKREEMAAAARRRAESFSRQSFLDRMTALVTR